MSKYGIENNLGDKLFLTDLASSDDIQELEECNEIDDEYEKVNNPLSYHLKQHFIYFDTIFRVFVVKGFCKKRVQSEMNAYKNIKYQFHYILTP